MIRGRLVVHGHFYQPLRADPFTGQVPREPGAAPFHDWNERIDAECYRPNAERGNLGHISFDIGPTLAGWLETADPATYAGFIGADRPAPETHLGNAMAQPFHHSILPLASIADRRTEIRWGIRDFELRFGHRPAGMWLPETAVDMPTLRIAAEEGIGYTILAPWQSADAAIDTRRLYRVAVGGGRAIGVAFYDGSLSGAVSFDPAATADADQFIRDRLLPRFGLSPAEQAAINAGAARGAPERRRRPRVASATPAAEPPLVVIATDGELYGHHQKFRDLFLHRLVAPDAAPGGADRDRGFDVVSLSAAFDEVDLAAMPPARIVERTAWSCHHGVARWFGECPDAADGRWKDPLRSALQRLAAGIDATALAVTRAESPGVDLWQDRDAYVDVVVGAVSGTQFAARALGRGARMVRRDRFLDLMEAQRWRLAMFASDAWFWDDPVRPETRQVLRAAARAARLVDAVAGTGLEARLADDLTLLTSPSRGIDGLAIYREALSEIGQPVP